MIRGVPSAATGLAWGSLFPTFVACPCGRPHLGMLAVASIHLMSLEAPKTAEGSSLGDLLPKNIDF